jgi:hypothetical protein
VRHASNAAVLLLSVIAHAQALAEGVPGPEGADSPSRYPRPPAKASSLELHAALLGMFTAAASWPSASASLLMQQASGHFPWARLLLAPFDQQQPTSSSCSAARPDGTPTTPGGSRSMAGSTLRASGVSSTCPAGRDGSQAAAGAAPGAGGDCVTLADGATAGTRGSKYKMARTSPAGSASYCRLPGAYAQRACPRPEA